MADRKGAAGAGRGPVDPYVPVKPKKTKKPRLVVPKPSASPQPSPPKKPRLVVPKASPSPITATAPRAQIVSDAARIAREKRAARVAKSRAKMQATVFGANTAIFYPDALTEKPKSPRTLVPGSPASLGQQAAVARERRGLSLGVPGLDPTRQPKQDRRGVPEYTPPKKGGKLGAIGGFVKDRGVDWVNGLDDTPGAAGNFVKEVAKGNVLAGRGAEYVQAQVAAKGWKALAPVGKDSIFGPEFLGALTLDAAFGLVGPETVDAIRGKGFDPKMIALEGVLATPFLRGPKYLAIALREIAKGRTLAEATNVARAAYVESRPVITGYRNIRAAKTGVQIRAADSRAGRTVEAVADKVRDKRFVPLKSSQSLQGEAILRGAKLKEGEVTAGARWVKSRTVKFVAAVNRISPEMQLALRMVAEGTTPEERIAFHAAEAAKAIEIDDIATATLHQYQADAAAKAARWLDLDNGAPVLSKAAPARLQKAMAVLRAGAEDRDDLIRELGVMQDLAMVRRLHAPARVYRGAQWTKLEKIIESKLDGIPQRKEFYDVVANLLGDDAARVHLALLDARARAYADNVVGNPEAVDAFFAKWGDAVVEDAQYVAPGRVGLPTMPGESQWIPGHEQLTLDDQSKALLMQSEEGLTPEVKAEYGKMARRLVRKHSDALPENANTVAKMSRLLLELRQRAIDAEQYRLWYENSAQAILREAKGDKDLAVKLAKLIAIYSPRAKVYDNTAWNNTTRALGAFDEWMNQKPVSEKWSLSKNRFGKDGQPLPDWQTIAAQNVMDELGDWEGIKTNSFYSNFLKFIDPERHAAEFGDQARKVTIDTWMRRAFRYLRGSKEAIEQRGDQLFDAPLQGKGQEQINTPMYRFMEDATAQIGDELGWEPHQAQAAIWTSIKAEEEGTPLKDAGLDFADAIKGARERQSLAAGEQRLFDPESFIPGGAGDIPAAPITLDRFLREEFYRAYGRFPGEKKGGRLTASEELRRFEDDFDHLDPDDPRRVQYEELLDQHVAPDLGDPYADIPFQLEGGDNVGKFVMPDEASLAQLGPRQLEVLHRQAMRNGTQEEILSIRKLLAEAKAGDPLESAFNAPSPRRNARPEPNVEGEPAGAYSDPRVAPNAAGLPDDDPLKQLLKLHNAFARDIARTLPEEEWPSWVKNNIRQQGVKVERVGDENVITPGELPFFQQERVLYHGAPSDRGAQIRETRTIRAGDERGENQGQKLAWVTTDPEYARQHGEDVIEIPFSALPKDAVRVGGPGGFGPESYAVQHDIHFQEEAAMGDLEGLPTTVKYGGEEHTVGHSPELRSIAEQYMQGKEWQYAPPTKYVDRLDPVLRAEFARQYEEALDWLDPAATPEYRAAVERSYRAFAEETLDQYRLLEDAGYTFEFYPQKGIDDLSPEQIGQLQAEYIDIFGEEALTLPIAMHGEPDFGSWVKTQLKGEFADPYPASPRQAIADLTENKHMYVYPTEAGYGAGQQGITHPLLELVPGLQWGGRDVTWNDLFRAVHDVFGHGKEGVGFRAEGEDMAWHSHAAMYSPEARPAMTMETRGQNSWVNYGPHGESNRTASQSDTVYAEQKAALPPASMMDTGDHSHLDAIIEKASNEPDSVHLLAGDLTAADSSGAGSAYGHAEHRVPVGQLSIDDLVKYRDLNNRELGWPQHRLGIWHDPDKSDLVLDVGRGFDNAAEAIDFGKREGQLAIWDGEKAVPTGVTEMERDEIQKRLRDERGGLTQRSEYQRRGSGTGAIVAATDFRSGKARFIFSKSSDASTIEHEIAHYARRLLTPAQERTVAKWAGAKPIRRVDPETGKKKIVGYEWSREAEEQWAETVTSVLRQGRGPASVKSAVNAVSKDLRESYRVQDMPDVPPHVAELVYRLFDYAKQSPKRGRLWGDDFVGPTTNGGLIYLPYGGTAGVAASKAAREVATYAARAKELSVQRPSRGAAMSVNPKDPGMTHEFKGALIESGDFDPGLEPWVKAKMIEGKIAALQYARKQFLKEATPLPTSPTDIPMKVDPTKDTSDDLRQLYQRFGFLDIEGGVDLTDLEKIDWNDAEELWKGISPTDIEGRSIAETVLDLLRDGAKPIDNIVWVPERVIKPFYSHASAGIEKYGALGKGFKITTDLINDYQKALVLFLHPAYVPMQMIGNSMMNLFQQGIFMPRNLWRAVRLHHSLTGPEMLKLDSYAGIGSASVVMDMSSFGKPFSATLGHWANLAADLIPRRAAWLHEAHRAGYKTPEEIKALINATSDDAHQIKLDIATKARDAIVDFDRLSPFEKNVATRIIWFYPWLRGATRYTGRFALEHPALAGGMALLALYAQNYKDEKYGDLPNYLDSAVPLDTGVLPGGKQLFGDHQLADGSDNPYFLNLRQVLTQSTPVDLSRTAWGFINGDPTTPPLSENLAPFLNAFNVAINGYDPYEDKVVPRGVGTFFKKLTPTEAPAVKKLQRIFDPPEESDFRVYRRGRGAEAANLLFGSTAPVAVNIPAAQRSAAKDKGDFYARAKIDLERQAKKAGWKVPARVYKMLRLRADVEKGVEATTDPIEKARVAAKVYAKETGNRFPLEALSSADMTDERAQQVYEEIRRELFGDLNAIERELAAESGEG